MTGNKIINLPNLLTLARFLLIIPFVYYFLNSEIHISLLIFAVIALSDKLDGISARLMNQRTELGSALDSFTDWTLITSTFALLSIKNYINILWVVLLVVPALISGLLKILYAKRQKIVPVTLIARISVVLTYITIIAILINFTFKYYLLIATVASIYFASVSYLLKTWSMLQKSVPKNSTNSH